MTIKELDSMLSNANINDIFIYVSEKIRFLHLMDSNLETVMEVEDFKTNFTFINDIGKINSKLVAQVRPNKMESFFYSALEENNEKNKEFNQKVKYGSKKREIFAKGLVIKYIMETFDLGLVNIETKVDSLSFEETSIDKEEDLTHLEQIIDKLYVDLLVPNFKIDNELATAFNYHIKQTGKTSSSYAKWIRQQLLGVLSKKYNVDIDVIIKKLENKNEKLVAFSPMSTNEITNYLIYKDEDDENKKDASYQINKPQE